MHWNASFPQIGGPLLATQQGAKGSDDQEEAEHASINNSRKHAKRMKSQEKQTVEKKNKNKS